MHLFVAAWLLCSLVAVHLFSFRKARKLYFPSTARLHDTVRQHRMRRMLRHWLLLFLRLLAFSFLWLAFFGHEHLFPGGKKDRKRVALFLDNSMSMTHAVSQSTSGFAAALSWARRLPAQYPSDAEYMLFTHDFSTPRPVSSQAVPGILATLEYAPLARSYQAVGQTLRRAFTQPADLYFIGDFQPTASTKISSLFHETDSVHRWHALLIPYASHENVFVDSLAFSSPFFFPGAPYTLEAFLRNTGDEDRRQVPVAFFPPRPTGPAQECGCPRTCHPAGDRYLPDG